MPRAAPHQLRGVVVCGEPSSDVCRHASPIYRGGWEGARAAGEMVMP